MAGAGAGIVGHRGEESAVPDSWSSSSSPELQLKNVISLECSGRTTQLNTAQHCVDIT